MDTFSVTGSDPDWRAVLVRAAEDDDFFRVFRGDRVFARVVEGTPKIAGQLLARRLMETDFFPQIIPKISAGDQVGSPDRSVRLKIAQNTYYLSPTVLRYCLNLKNMLEIFGLSLFDVPVYEIGGGYGGERKVFRDVAEFFAPARHPQTYTIFDLPESFALIRKFLNVFDYQFSVGSLEQRLEDMPSLVISNAAISEMTSPLIETYLERVISPASMGYFVTNFEVHSAPHPGGWTTERFVEEVYKIGKTDVTLVPGKLAFSPWGAKAQNLVVFGGDASKITKPPILEYAFYVQLALISKLGLHRAGWNLNGRS